MIRWTLLLSLLAHGAVLAAFMAWPAAAPAPPDEMPGLDVILGPIQAPGSGALPAAAQPEDAPAEDAPAEDAPERQAEAVPETPAAGESRPQPPASPEPPRPAAPREPAPPVQAELALPPPPPPPPPPAALPEPPPPPPPPARRRAEPPARQPPVVRSALGEDIALLLPDTPGTGTEGEELPVREVPGIHNPPPIYPEAARQRGQQGAVGVRLRVDVDGSVLRAEVVQSSGYPLLDQAVVTALRRWHFAPALKGGKPVAADFLHRTVFRLD